MCEPDTCTDVDGDGICADVDCDDNNPNVSTPIACDYNGSVCGDFDLCVAECPVPPTEVCDGDDNDCDGAIDEGDVCSCPDADGDGVCDDVDCNDTDPTISTPISCDYDGNVCGAVDLCVLECPVPPTEVCGDGIDNNCNNVVDEGCGDTCGNGVINPGEECNEPGLTCGANETCNINTCLCVPTSCPDADNDGVCDDVDCNDNDPNVSTPISCDFNGTVC